MLSAFIRESSLDSRSRCSRVGCAWAVTKIWYENSPRQSAMSAHGQGKDQGGLPRASECGIAGRVVDNQDLAIEFATQRRGDSSDYVFNTHRFDANSQFFHRDNTPNQC
jgi:hypothetical protein